MAKRHAQLVSLSVLLLLVLSYSVEGSRQLEGDGEKMVIMEGAMIGSRPPSCEGRCSNCGHCEAVQVPLVPQEKERGDEYSSGRRGSMVKDSAAPTTTLNSRGDEYSSNYKPMNWKCKCGDVVLNP